MRLARQPFQVRLIFFHPPRFQRRSVPMQSAATSKTKKGVRFAYGMVMELL